MILHQIKRLANLSEHPHLALKYVLIFGIVLGQNLYAADNAIEPEGARYAGLIPGARLTYEVKFTVTGRFTMPPQIGKVVETIDDEKQLGDHRYFQIRTESSGFENLPDRKYYQRVAEDAVRSFNDGMDPSTEYILIPLPPTEGRTWSIEDGEDTWHYRLENSGSIETPAGRFEDCIAVAMKLESQTSKFDIVVRNIYCAGIGKVHMRSEAKYKHGTSITETTLQSFSQ